MRILRQSRGRLNLRGTERMTGSDLETVVANFEAAFNASSDIDICKFAPDRNDENYFEIVTELIRVEMELAWKTDGRKCIDDFARLFPEVIQDEKCFDRIAFEEYRLRVSSGEEVTPLDYQSRYSIKAYHWPVLSPVEIQDQARKLATHSMVNDESEFLASGSPMHTQPDLAGRIVRGQLSSTPTVESSLHGRLRWIGLTILFSLMYLSVLAWINPVSKVGLFLGSPWLLWLNGICMMMCLLICFILWSRRRIQISILRILELVLFGSVLVELSCGLVSDLFVDHELSRPIMEGDHALFHYASSWSLPYFALIVAYGTLVPSSWQRCTINVSLIAITPIVICTVASIALHGLSVSFFQSFLLQMVIWMSIAAAIAIYGVRRLEKTQFQISKSGNLGRYRLVRQIAAGGMGEVFQAENSMLNLRFAIKIMHSKWSMLPHLLTRFEQEVQVLAGLSHPNIVRIHDVGFTNEGVFYYVMEFLEGKNLHQFVIDHGPLAPNVTIKILIQVADALNLIHRGGIVHRDIKPSNIFLAKFNGKETTKLLDFGLIKSVADEESNLQLTQDGAIIGTPAFMSPEQAAGENVDHRADLYCLGAVAYFALTGRQVFDRPTAVETLSAHINSEPPPIRSNIRSLPPELEDLLFRCLSKDPGCRFQTADELAEALRDIEV